MAAERIAHFASALHIGHRPRESSATKTATQTGKFTMESYLKMTLDAPYLMDGSEPPPHLNGRKNPVNDWAPYSNPASETGRDV